VAKKETLEQEVERLRDQIFDAARNPTDDDRLWPTIERKYNDMLAENLRLRDQLREEEIYSNKREKTIGRYIAALEVIAKYEDQSSHTIAKDALKEENK